MRISAKARYGLASMIHLAQNYHAGEYITILSLSSRLNISKIYLEQVFSLLKRADLVLSTKGSQGGYILSRVPGEITAFDILSSIDESLFERTADTVPESAKNMEAAMRSLIFEALDDSVKASLTSISLEALVGETERFSADEGYMFYL